MNQCSPTCCICCWGIMPKPVMCKPPTGAQGRCTLAFLLLCLLSPTRLCRNSGLRELPMELLNRKETATTEGGKMDFSAVILQQHLGDSSSVEKQKNLLIVSQRLRSEQVRKDRQRRKRQQGCQIYTTQTSQAHGCMRRSLKFLPFPWGT